MFHEDLVGEMTHLKIDQGHPPCFVASKSYDGKNRLK